jgi:hypothetical protein
MEKRLPEKIMLDQKGELDGLRSSRAESAAGVSRRGETE